MKHIGLLIFILLFSTVVAAVWWRRTSYLASVPPISVQCKFLSSAPNTDNINYSATVYAEAVNALPKDNWGKSTQARVYNSSGPPTALKPGQTVQDITALLNSPEIRNYATVYIYNAPGLPQYGWNGPGCYTRFVATNMQTAPKVRRPWIQYWQDNSVIVPGSMVCPPNTTPNYATGSCTVNSASAPSAPSARSAPPAPPALGGGGPS